MKLFSLILRIFVLVACVILIFGGQTASAHDDDEGELDDESDLNSTENLTQNSLDSDHFNNENGTVELY